VIFVQNYLDAYLTIIQLMKFFQYILRALIDNVNTNIGVQNIIIYQNFLFLLVVYRPSQNP
jgi:hypothetical protein